MEELIAHMKDHTTSLETSCSRECVLVLTMRRVELGDDIVDLVGNICCLWHIFEHQHLLKLVDLQDFSNFLEII